MRPVAGDKAIGKRYKALMTGLVRAPVSERHANGIVWTIKAP